MQNRLGVIDLGTNTFHILIAEIMEDGSFRDLYRKRIYVKLAEEGIQKIGDAPFQRGLNALIEYRQTLADFKVSKVRAFGTAALRTAQNGPDFIQAAKVNTNIDIQLIPGSREALLIHKGVSLAVPFPEENSLIMDIGGGSVEYIIANRKEVLWSQSFPVGVAVLFKELHHTDPIHPSNIQSIKDFLHKALEPLQKALQTFPCQYLIGASGTFDVLENFLTQKDPSALFSQINIKQFSPFYESLLKTNLQERFAMTQLPDSRAEMIIVALILIDFIIQMAQINEIYVSAFAMKEGILAEMSQELK